MKIKVGQWGRNKTHLFKCSGITVAHYHDRNETHYEYSMPNDTMSYYCCEEDIIKVANTPQELIEVKDLIILDNLPHIVVSGDSRYYDFERATKILTPKGKDYICQWEAE